MSKRRELKGFRRGPARRGMKAKHYGKFRPIDRQAARFLSHPKRMRNPRKLSKREERILREQAEAIELIVKRRANQSVVRRRSRIAPMKTKKEPYSQRTDAEKLESNWRKTLGLLQRSKYSMAIVRAGTCAEIAANIVARAELIQKRHLEPAFVDTLLRWANGLQGKFSRIILPVLAGTAQHATFRKLQKNVRKLNDARNKIAHTGRFAKSESAHKLVLVTHKLCIALTEPYEDRLRLPKPW